MESKENQKDLLYYLSKTGKGIKGLFKSKPKHQNDSKVENQAMDIESIPKADSKGVMFADLLKVKPSNTSHKFSFGEVYANDLARVEIEKDNPKFPVGSIIVREKNKTATSKIPELVIAMIKREKGFSKKTGDWEFLTFNGIDLQIKERQTVGNCADCHTNAKKTDWVFRDYLKTGD